MLKESNTLNLNNCFRGVCKKDVRFLKTLFSLIGKKDDDVVPDELFFIGSSRNEKGF